MNTTELVVEITPEKNSGPYGICTHDLCTDIAEVMGVNPVRTWIFFSGLISTTISVVFIAADLLYSFLHRSAYIWFSYIYKLVIILKLNKRV